MSNHDDRPPTLATHLGDRGVIRVAGPDALKLLDGLVTNDLERLSQGLVIHAGLLAPQGKILFAMFLYGDGDDILIDVPRQLVGELIKRLTLYRLRAKVTFEDISDRVGIAAVWGEPIEVPAGVLGGADPRSTGLGARYVLPLGRIGELPGEHVDVAVYDDHRIALGIGNDDRDYARTDTFPHEANFDLTSSVDFKKGCFVGQEVVSRMQHKTVVRKRVVKVSALAEDRRLQPGTNLYASGIPAPVGEIGSVSNDGRSALAFVKLDRVSDTLDKGGAITAGEGADAAAIEVDGAALQRYRAAVVARAAREERNA